LIAGYFTPQPDLNRDVFPLFPDWLALTASLPCWLDLLVAPIFNSAFGREVSLSCCGRRINWFLLEVTLPFLGGRVKSFDLCARFPPRLLATDLKVLNRAVVLKALCRGFFLIACRKFSLSPLPPRRSSRLSGPTLEHSKGFEGLFLFLFEILVLKGKAVDPPFPRVCFEMDPEFPSGRLLDPFFRGPLIFSSQADPSDVSNDLDLFPSSRR